LCRPVKGRFLLDESTSAADTRFRLRIAAIACAAAGAGGGTPDWTRQNKHILISLLLPSRSRDRRDAKRPAEAEPPVDPEEQARLLAALEGGAEDEEDRLIEERRRRRQAILAKHAEAAAVSAPTATAAAGAAAGVAPEAAVGSGSAAGDAAKATPVAVAADGSAPVAAAAASAPPLAAASPRSGAASPALGAAPAEREGSASPDLSDDDGSTGGGGGGDGDLMDIWQRPAEVDAAEEDAASRPMGSDGSAAQAPMAVGTSLAGADGRGSTLGADVSEAEFASEAQKAQEQTQVRRTCSLG